MTDANQSFPSSWHVPEATRTLYNGLRRHLKMLLRLPPKPEAPVVSGPMDIAVARYHQICSRLLEELGPNPVLTDKVMCEAGAGDGLAVAALLISLGAYKVHLVELNPPVASLRQIEILEQLQKRGSAAASRRRPGVATAALEGCGRVPSMFHGTNGNGRSFRFDFFQLGA